MLRAFPRNWLTLPLIIVLFLLVFRLEYLTPMISDDFSFYLKGFSLEAIKSHYMGWGGRILADTSASAVLGIGNHFVIAFINALAVVALVTIITRLPLFGERKNTALNALVFFLIFSLYWVANPNLGDTTFWIVGSAHYLWTNVFNFLFLLLFIRETQSRQSSTLKTALLFLLGIAAGCSNENTGLTSLGIIVLLSIREFRNGNKDWKLALYAAGFALGIATLLLAPGNFARGHSFPEWYALSFGQQLFIHFVKRWPDGMVQYWEVFLVLILLIKFQPKLSKETKFYAVLFVLASFVANAVFMPAPVIPKRALNGGFIYLLIATSFVAYSFLSQAGAKLKLFKLITVVCGLHFAVSYALMDRAYSGTAEQALVRTSLIEQGIKNGADHIEIPKYYFTYLLRNRERFDTYFNGAAMADYYGTKAKITEYPTNQPYSLARPPTKP